MPPLARRSPGQQALLCFGSHRAAGRLRGTVWTYLVPTDRAGRWCWGQRQLAGGFAGWRGRRFCHSSRTGRAPYVRRNPCHWGYFGFSRGRACSTTRWTSNRFCCASGPSFARSRAASACPAAWARSGRKSCCIASPKIVRWSLSARIGDAPGVGTGDAGCVHLRAGAYRLECD